MKDDLVLRVRKDLCLGCGLCAESCPRQAISLPSGQAQIDQNRCNRCGLCLDVCPQGAITELTPVSRRELQAAVTGLKDRTEDILARIERLKGNSDRAKQDER
ncbi:MAG TPA: 4Fe-4S binding protein [Dehalococcoidia bacterium]|nr:4Fe-4S binding protein [Dehalococcoidia bacterium]